MEMLTEGQVLSCTTQGQLRRDHIVINSLQLFPLYSAYDVSRKRAVKLPKSASQSESSRKYAQLIAESELTKSLNKNARDREIRRLCVSDNFAVADQSSSSSALPCNDVAYGFGFKYSFYRGLHKTKHNMIDNASKQFGKYQTPPNAQPYIS